MPIELTKQNDGVRLKVKVVPGSSRSRVVGKLGDSLKIAVAAPPQGGAANQALIKLLAQTFEISSGRVEILRGHGTARKEILIRGVSAQDLAVKLAQLL